MIVRKVEVTSMINEEIYYKLLDIAINENIDVDELINDILIDYFEIMTS